MPCVDPHMLGAACWPAHAGCGVQVELTRWQLVLHAINVEMLKTLKHIGAFYFHWNRRRVITRQMTFPCNLETSYKYCTSTIFGNTKFYYKDLHAKFLPWDQILHPHPSCMVWPFNVILQMLSPCIACDLSLCVKS